jgi:hypothetical protein
MRQNSILPFICLRELLRDFSKYFEFVSKKIRCRIFLSHFLWKYKRVLMNLRVCIKLPKRLAEKVL